MEGPSKPSSLGATYTSDEWKRLSIYKPTRPVMKVVIRTVMGFRKALKCLNALILLCRTLYLSIVVPTRPRKPNLEDILVLYFMYELGK